MFNILALKSLLELKRLKKTQYEEPEKTNKKRLVLLKKTLLNAYLNTEHYKRVFDEKKVSPKNIKSLKDLAKFPFLTKDVFRRRPETITSEKAKGGYTTNISSGSTGVASIIKRDYEAEASIRAANRRMRAEWGEKVWEKKAMLMSPEDYIRKKGFYRRLLLAKTRQASLYDDWEKQTKWLSETRPNIIASMPSNLQYLALNSQKLPKPKLVYTGGETLTESKKKIITEAFGTVPLDIYGCSETGNVAWLCPESEKYHVNHENVVMEILNENGEEVGDGEEGQIVLTSLVAQMMPIIRFKTGDYATKTREKCVCGKTLPLVEKIVGKTMQPIRLANKRHESPLRLYKTVKNVPGVEYKKIVQTRVGEIIVEYVRGKNFDQKSLKTLSEGPKKILGKDSKIRLKGLKRVPGGKQSLLLVSSRN